MKSSKNTGRGLFFLCLSFCLSLCFSFISLSCQANPDQKSRHPADKGLDGEKRERLARGRALYLKGDGQSALKLFEDLYKEEPEDLEVCTAYARVLLYSADPSGVLNVWERLPDEQRERSVDLIGLTAEAAVLLGRIDMAEAVLKKGLRLSSEDTGLLLLLARCRRDRGRYDEALALLETARHLAGRDVAIYLETAKIYAENGMDMQAEEALEAGLSRLSPDHPLVPALKEILNK